MTSQVSSAKGSICKAEYAKPKLVSLVLYLNLELKHQTTTLN